MHFVLQFGEFVGGTGTDWVNIIISAMVSFFTALIGAGSAIYVYRNGTKDQVDREMARINKEDISRIKYLKYLMSQGVKELKSITGGVDKVVESFGKEGDYVTGMSYAHQPLICIERITKNISQEQYFLTLTTHIERIRPQRIFLAFDSAQDVVSNMLNDIKQKGRKIEMQYEELMDIVNECHNILIRLVVYSQEKNLSNEKGNLSKMILTIMGDYAENDQKKKSCDAYISDVVEPLLELCQPYVYDSEVSKVIGVLANSQNKYNFLKRLNEARISNMVRYKNNIEMLIEVVDSSLTEIESFLSIGKIK